MRPFYTDITPSLAFLQFLRIEDSRVQSIWRLQFEGFNLKGDLEVPKFEDFNSKGGFLKI
jgi:hypothetical protein